MDTRQIIDFAAEDDAKSMREALYASIYDRVSNAFESKKQELAHNLMGMPLSTEEVQLEAKDEDEAEDKKAVEEATELDEIVRVKPTGNMISKKFGGYNQQWQRDATAKSVKDTRALNRKTGGPTKGAKSGEYDAPWSDKVSTYNNPVTKAFARPAAQGKDVNEGQGHD
jgi:hypothetical protein